MPIVNNQKLLSILEDAVQELLRSMEGRFVFSGKTSYFFDVMLKKVGERHFGELLHW